MSKTVKSKSVQRQRRLHRPLRNAQGGKKKKPNDQWKTSLPTDQYRIARAKRTPNPLLAAPLGQPQKRRLHLHLLQTAPVFSSENKFDSGPAGPASSKPVADERLQKIGSRVAKEKKSSAPAATAPATSSTMARSTHLRFCVNSASNDIYGTATNWRRWQKT